ncbi:MAG: helix-turn-helix transcriptional regulator [Spirochaetes bacterium]|nr:helix-turn-helix transcriptional regulator [Spirochaetota bacterium]
MPVDKNYSLSMPLGTQRSMNRRILSVGLESYENGVFNSMNITLLGFGKVMLDRQFRSEERRSFCNEMNVVFKGRGRLRYNGKETIMTPGNVYFFPAGGSMSAYGNEPLYKYYFQFRMLMNGCEVFRDARALSVKAPRDILVKLSAGTASRPPDILAVRAHALGCLSLFSKQLGSLIEHRRGDYSRFEPFFRYVNEHLNGEFSLADYGEHSGQSAKNFAAQFKKQFGESPKKYFLREKVNRIKEALFYSDRMLSEIGDTFGFSDQFYFSRFFKKMTGITPSDYRSSIAGERMAAHR